MKDLLFISDDKGYYVADFISSGRSAVNINRLAAGDLRILAAIGDLPPTTIYRFGNDSPSVLLFELCLIAGIRITIKSQTEVIEAKIIET